MVGGVQFYLLHSAAVPVRLPIGGTDGLHHVNAGVCAGAVGEPVLVHSTLGTSGTVNTLTRITGAGVDCGEVGASSAALLL